MTTRISSSIYENCFSHHGDVKDLAVKNSIPVPYFGDVTGYFNSPIRIITVGLNPSDKEFEDKKKNEIFHRFDVTANTPISLEQTLCEYFRKGDPYRIWFNSFETILNAMGATYGFPEKAEKTIALHVDAGSPIATEKKWSDLKAEELEKLVAPGRAIFKRLLAELRPHLVMASIGWSHIGPLEAEFVSLGPWQELVRYDCNENGHKLRAPAIVQMKEIEIGADKALWINGAAARNPYGMLTKPRKKLLSPLLLKEIKSRGIVKTLDESIPA